MSNINLSTFRLQFITHGNTVAEIVDGARSAILGGCRWVQLRMKDAPTDKIVAAGRQIAAMCADGCTFIIDDHVELVDVLKADGVHLGHNDMPVAKARAILGACRIIGATANTAADIAAAAASGADYIGLGPFRFTSTKKNLSPVLGLDGYNNIMSQVRQAGITVPVVAIGGITADDIPAIIQTGVRGVAISGAIINARNPVELTSRILNLLSI